MIDSLIDGFSLLFAFIFSLDIQHIRSSCTENFRSNLKATEDSRIDSFVRSSINFFVQIFVRVYGDIHMRVIYVNILYRGIYP